MLGIHALVAEDTAYLVNTVQAADNEPLEVQLGFDTQVHIHIQRIVVGDKGSGGGTDLQRHQNGGIHLQKALAVQIAADLAEDAAALDKGLAHLRIDDQIHIALTVAGIGIPQAVEFFRQRQQRLGKQPNMGGMHRDLALLGAEHRPLDAQDITDIPLFEIGVVLFADVVPADIYLQAAGGILQIQKAGLAHHAAAHHAAGDTHRFALQRLKIVADLLVGGIPIEPGHLVGVFTGLLHRRQFFPAHLDLLLQRLFLGRLVYYLFFTHRGSSFIGTKGLSHTTS